MCARFNSLNTYKKNLKIRRQTKFLSQDLFKRNHCHVNSLDKYLTPSYDKTQLQAHYTQVDLKDIQPGPA